MEGTTVHAIFLSVGCEWRLGQCRCGDAIRDICVCFGNYCNASAATAEVESGR